MISCEFSDYGCFRSDIKAFGIIIYELCRGERLTNILKGEEFNNVDKIILNEKYGLS